MVGCGTGEEAGILARSYGAETTGIDLVTQFTLDHAQAAPAKLIEMDAREMRFEDASFDFVYYFHALEHIARELGTVASANLALAQYHRERQERLSTA